MKTDKEAELSSDEHYYKIDKALYDLFYGALEAGEDIVLQHQFENDPPAKHRYADRCIKEAKDTIAAQLTQAKVEAVLEARIDELERLYNPDSGIMASHYIYLTDGAADEINKELRDRIDQLKSKGV